MPLRSPVRWLIRISKLIHPKQNFWFSLQTLLFSKSSPTKSRASHRHNCSGQKPKNAPQFLSSLYTPLESINTHLSKHILNLPSLPQPPVITHLILDSSSKSLLAGLSIVYCPRTTTVIFLEHESGHMLPPDNPHVMSLYNLSPVLPKLLYLSSHCPSPMANQTKFDKSQPIHKLNHYQRHGY